MIYNMFLAHKQLQELFDSIATDEDRTKRVLFYQDLILAIANGHKIVAFMTTDEAEFQRLLAAKDLILAIASGQNVDWSIPVAPVSQRTITLSPDQYREV